MCAEFVTPEGLPLCDRLSRVLSFLLDVSGVPETELARRAQVPRATLNRLVNGKTDDPRASTLLSIASFFGISLEQLVGHEPIAREQVLAVLNQTATFVPATAEKSAIPLVGWEQAIHLGAGETVLTPDTWSDWIAADPIAGPKSFALEVQGASMAPRFMEHSIIVVDPDVRAQAKDYVLVKYAGQEEAVFRQLQKEGSESYLVPLQEGFRIFPLANEDDVLGVVVQTRMNHRTIA